MEKLELAVEDLLLDLENPRIGRATTQSEALTAIVDLSLDHFRTMMKSIREHGLDPGDSFYLVNEDDDIIGYTVVDGNRRLAALKVLADPTILQGTTLTSGATKQLLSAADSFDPKALAPISCVLFDDRAAANDWILRRHGRGMEGEGRIAWNPLETQRFQHDWTILDVIDFVERNSTFSDETWPAIRTAVTNNSSTLRRFIDAKSARDWLGVEVTEKDGARVPAFKRDAKFVLGVLSRIFSDISTNHITSRSYNKASEIAGYLDALPDELHPSGGPGGTAKLFREATISDSATRPRQRVQTPPSRPKTTKPKPPRGTLAPARHPFIQPKTTKGQQLLREASKLRLADMPLAGAYLLRAFLEHTIDTYMKRHNLPFHETTKDGTKQLELRLRADRVFEHLRTSGVVQTKELKGVKTTLTSKDDPASIHTLNDYHHDKYQVPAVDVLRNAWDSAESLYIAVYGCP